MKKKISFIFFGIILVGIIFVSVFANNKTEKLTLNTFEVSKGQFEIVVVSTGELQAASAMLISGPEELRGRSLRMGDIQISDLIPEGTEVEAGDYIAELDRSTADNLLKDVLDNLEVAQSNLSRIKIDTTIQLTTLRGEILDLKFNVDQTKIALEQSKYEPPATIRKAEVNLEKAERAYSQTLKNYDLKVLQFEANMREAEIEYESRLREKAAMESVLDKFTIYSPAAGMVIYHRESDGSKRIVGSTINSFDLTIAELPNLNMLSSITYINEIDINLLKIGQPVYIGFDAFPEKRLPGIVTEISNVGYQLPNTDAKVFEVIIKVLEYDLELKPSMTTFNKVNIATYDSVYFVPIQFVHFENDGEYVYDVEGNKIKVVLGKYNDVAVIIKEGLKTGDILLVN